MFTALRTAIRPTARLAQSQAKLQVAKPMAIRFVSTSQFPSSSFLLSSPEPEAEKADIQPDSQQTTNGFRTTPKLLLELSELQITLRKHWEMSSL